MDSSSPPSGASREAVRRVFAEADEPHAPFTTVEVVDALGCSAEAATRHLRALVDDGALRRKELEGDGQIWWRPETDAALAGQPSQLREFGAFVNAVKDYAIFMLEPDGTVASWNRGAKRIKGYDEGEIVGEHFSTFYTEEDRENDVPAENLEKAAAESRVEDEGWRVRKDGSRFWANVTITAIRGGDGTLQGFTKVTRDMTEQREYELQLRRERDLIEQVFETVPEGICVVDADGEFVRANREVLELFDLERDDVGQRSIEITPLYDEDGRRVPDEECPWRRVLASGDPVYDFQSRIEQSDGESRWLSINAVPLEGSVPDDSNIVVAIEEITDQKHRERQLEQRKSELETELGEILGRISDAFFALDEEWAFTHLNEHAAELFRRSEAELYGRSFQEAFPDRFDGRLGEGLREALATQEPANFELYDDELDAWLEYTVYPSESGLSVYIHDITDRRQYQRKLEESNERLEQFAYAASHDLQEPLRMVSSYLQLLEDRYADELDEDAEEFIEFAVDGADRMRDMIEGLLQYSRVDTRGRPLEPVDLDDVLAEAQEDLRLRIEESAAEIVTEPLPTVEGDGTQLAQLFQNLLENAIEYSGEEPPEIEITAERAGAEWVVSVRDEGIGIDPESADRVFEVFQRLHSADEYEGTGIGLALCERIVERHGVRASDASSSTAGSQGESAGGEIWVDSEPGKGATFSFTLPAVEEAA